MFHYGDEGNHFYILIEGEVEVRVPLPTQLEDEDATPEGLLLFLIRNYEDIYWKLIDRRISIIQILNNELKENKI